MAVASEVHIVAFCTRRGRAVSRSVGEASVMKSAAPAAIQQTGHIVSGKAASRRSMDTV